MLGHDVVINAAGHVSQGDRFVHLVRTVIEQTEGQLGPGTRLWQFGGAAVLSIPGTDFMGVELPLVPQIYQAHLRNYEALQSWYGGRANLKSLPAQVSTA